MEADAVEAVCALVEALIKTAAANLATTITQAQADPVSLFVVPWANITVAEKVITVNAMETATARAAALKADLVTSLVVPWADVIMA